MNKTAAKVFLFVLMLLQSCGYCLEWLTETVDGENNSVGTFTSLALDSNGNPHISYYDEINKKLKYAYKDNNGWHIETVDNAGGAGVLAIDSGNSIHISYRDSAANYLKYGYRDSAGWHIETVDNGGLASEYISIAVAVDDQPHIVYVTNIQNVEGHYQEQYYYKSELKYARKDAAGWHMETAVSTDWQTTIRYLSLALDSHNTPHISYYCYTDLWPHSRPGWGRLLYVYNDSTEWIAEDVDPDNELSVGSFNSIAVDSENNIHISYYRETYQGYERNNLKYARKDSLGWHIETADSTAGVGTYASLVLDSNNNPRVSYYDESNKDLKYAFKDLTGWHLETVDSAGDTGSFTAIALDTRGNPHISYYDATNKDLKYASRCN